MMSPFIEAQVNKPWLVPIAIILSFAANPVIQHTGWWSLDSLSFVTLKSILAAGAISQIYQVSNNFKIVK